MSKHKQVEKLAKQRAAEKSIEIKIATMKSGKSMKMKKLDDIVQKRKQILPQGN
jgi:hypothetical protein